MNASFVETMKLRFISLLEEMDSTIEAAAEAPTAMAVGGDEVDQWSSERDHQMSLRMGGRAITYRKKLLQGLQKISDGTYGRCEECDCEIPSSRLLARPTADLCVICKEQSEKQEVKKTIKHLTLL
jgi:DnaK suppressor protein